MNLYIIEGRFVRKAYKLWLSQSNNGCLPTAGLRIQQLLDPRGCTSQLVFNICQNPIEVGSKAREGVKSGANRQRELLLSGLLAEGVARSKLCLFTLKIGLEVSLPTPNDLIKNPSKVCLAIWDLFSDVVKLTTTRHHTCLLTDYKIPAELLKLNSRNKEV